MSAHAEAVAVLRQAGLLAGGGHPRTEDVPGGSIGVLVRVIADDGRSWVVKTVPGVPAQVLTAEADGLRALQATGAVGVPTIHHEGPGVLVMAALGSVPDADPAYWERFAEDIADLHGKTRQERHGWPVDNWLGRLPQTNDWDTDGHRFFAEHRVVRFLPEPLLRQALSAEDSKAVERLAARLPELVPAMPAVLLHGDLWQGNLVTGGAGEPVLVDPAVSYGWAEIDVGMLWLLPRPAGSDRFFDRWAELTGPEPGWRDRARLLMVSKMLSVVAQHGERDRTAGHLRALLAPFRPRPVA